MSEPRVAVLGLGFMGRTHLRAYRGAAEAGIPNRLVAVCDQDPARLAGGKGPKGNIESDADGPLFDPREVRTTTEPRELFADDEIDLVSICTHTDTHVELATQALRAGKHALVEKPLALAAADVERLATAAREARTVCMPAMCMRFWPGWSWLRRAVSEAAYGRVRSAVFQRLATHPNWSASFYDDPTRNGGALFDLHVHDADFVRWCFGSPSAVFSTGTVDHLTTSYRFENGPEHVVAEGGWDHTAGYSFRMSYTVVFEDATVDFELGREPLVRLSRDGASTPVYVPAGTGYDGEIRHFLDVVARGGQPDATIEEAVGMTRMLEAERESLVTGASVAVP